MVIFVVALLVLVSTYER